MPMTDQELFDKVAKHLLTQKIRSVGLYSKGAPVMQCMYRGPNGLKCAVGCIIPDELYDPSFEGKAINSLKISNALIDAGIVSEGQILLLAELQSLHDVSSPNNWDHQLRVLARAAHLEFNH